ncbi:MAG: hypothetical protein OSB38_13905 [Paraburkholderia fungorum]|nr:hypothetical protein [Paraburkholderia fungorum]
MKKYLFYEVALPALLVCIVWMPVGLFGPLSGEAHLFFKVFATGDLLPICLLILINCFVRLEEAERKTNSSGDNGNWKAGIFLTGTMLFLVYVCIKLDAIPYEFPDKDHEIPVRIAAYAAADIVFFVVVVILGLFTVSRCESNAT